MNVVEVEGVTRAFGKKQVLKGVSLAIPRGDIAGLVGANGAGKTTLMRVIAGLIAPDAGCVRYAEGHRGDIGFLIEGCRADGALRVREAIEYRRRLLALPASESERVIAQIGLAPMLRAFVGALSTGMRQKLGIALALMGRPAFVMLDEPLSGLDPVGVRDMRARITELCREEGTTFLISGHMVGELGKMMTSCTLLTEGTAENVDLAALRASGRSLEDALLQRMEGGA